jgi:CDP-diacylglycerol--glycerol-3-phosphate 3-phosphatidyltransferase
LRVVDARNSPVIRNVPNVLTTLRLCAVPLFIALMVAGDGPTLAAGIVFMVASFTDFLDGWLARRFHVMSQYGKVIDPLADRLLVNSAVLLLCFYDSRWFAGDDGRLFGPEFVVVLARDLPAIYGYMRVREFTMVDVTQLGKWGMAMMMGGLTFLLLLPDATWPLWPFELGLAISVVVFAQYLRRYGWMLTAPRAEIAGERGRRSARARRRTSRNPEAEVETTAEPRVD